MPEDFYSIDLMNAYEELGSIVGEAVEDDLVNEIFSKFCMGKQLSPLDDNYWKNAKAAFFWRVGKNCKRGKAAFFQCAGFDLR